jgi:hypothetical protein
MADDPRIQHLLDELLDSHAAPEPICESYSELLPVSRLCRCRSYLVIRSSHPSPGSNSDYLCRAFPPSSNRATTG